MRIQWEKEKYISYGIHFLQINPEKTYSKNLIADNNTILLKAAKGIMIIKETWETTKSKLGKRRKLAAGQRKTKKLRKNTGISSWVSIVAISPLASFVYTTFMCAIIATKGLFSD